MLNFSDIWKKYPNLVYHIWDYFTDESILTNSEIDFSRYGIFEDLVIKSTLDFVMDFSETYKLDDGSHIDYKTIAKICDKLYEHNFFLKAVIGIVNLDEGNNYYYGYKNFGKGEQLLSRFNNNRNIISYIFNSLVYGFKYIYEYNKRNVLPLYVKKGDNQYTGTCFKTVHGLVTAKHCISKTDSIQIAGMNKDVFTNCSILTKDNLDIAVIQPNTEYQKEEYLLTSDGCVLDEIMVMGYPSHCGFDNFVTATKGSIAAIEESFLTKYDLMLLTSKLKGGNSGGPVFNEEGYVVGIITETPNPEGEGYDQFGYGLAMPQYYIEEIVKSGKQIDEKINFE